MARRPHAYAHAMDAHKRRFHICWVTRYCLLIKLWCTLLRRLPWVSGCNANLPTIIAFQSNNVRSNSRRSVANGVQFVFAAIGGIYASTTFMQEEYPIYRTGVCAMMFLHFRTKNRAADERGEIIQEEVSFRYTY
jgi:hypothetical protein